MKGGAKETVTVDRSRLGEKEVGYHGQRAMQIQQLGSHPPLWAFKRAFDGGTVVSDLTADGGPYGAERLCIHELGSAALGKY